MTMKQTKEQFVGITYDELLEENAKLREERDRLLMNASPTANELRRVRAAWEKDRAENAKLREECDRLIQAIEDLHDVRLEDRLVQLENENAKLRELACILAWCAVGADCDKCPINTLDFSEWPNGREICYSADDRMRELGIEVD